MVYLTLFSSLRDPQHPGFLLGLVSKEHTKEGGKNDNPSLDNTFFFSLSMEVLEIVIHFQ